MSKQRFDPADPKKNYHLITEFGKNPIYSERQDEDWGPSMPKLRSLAEIMAEKTVSVEKSDLQAEAAYRRGCHQTAAAIYRMIEGKVPDHVLKLVGAFEGVLCEYRENPNSGSLTLLWDAKAEAKRRSK